MTGTYQAMISRKTPACIVILLDQSTSMADQISGRPDSKAKAAASAVNRLLAVLAITSTKAVGEGPRPYFDVAVLGYGGDVLHGGDAVVTPRLPGSGRGSELVSIATLEKNPARMETGSRVMPDGKGGHVQTASKSYVWVDPVANGGTPMLEAMRAARTVIERWARHHQDSYPPIVINITDGEPYKDPTSAARALSDISTADGSSLLYNIHLSGAAETAISFPALPTMLPDKFARLLFDISSPLPDKIGQELRADYRVEPGARGFIFNSDPALLVKFLEVGTRVEEKKDNWDR
jgi:hypothetical protein